MSPRFKVSCLGRAVWFTEVEDGRWKHDQSSAAAVLGDGEESAIHARAEALLWCLNSGLAGGEYAVRVVNKRLAGTTRPRPKRWEAHERAGHDTYRSSGGEPFCVPLALYRARLIYHFQYWGPSGDDVPKSMQVAVEACRASQQELTADPMDCVLHFGAAIERAAEVVGEAERRTKPNGGHDPAGTFVGMMAAYADILRLADCQAEGHPLAHALAQDVSPARADQAVAALTHVLGREGVRRAVGHIFRDSILRAWFWDGYIADAAQSLPAERRWLYVHNSSGHDPRSPGPAPLGRGIPQPPASGSSPHGRGSPPGDGRGGRMRIVLRIVGRDVSLTSSADGRWSHNASSTSAVLAGGVDRQIFDRAEQVAWALNAGLVDGESVLVLNRRLGRLEARLKLRGHEGHDGDMLFDFTGDQPIALPLVLLRFDLPVSVSGFSGPLGQVDKGIKKSGLTNALLAAKVGPEDLWYSHDRPNDPFTDSLATALNVTEMIFHPSTPPELRATALADTTWVPLGFTRLCEPAFKYAGHLVEAVLQSVAFGEPMWSQGAMEAVADLEPRLKWLYGCAGLHHGGGQERGGQCGSLIVQNRHAVESGIRDEVEGALNLAPLLHGMLDPAKNGPGRKAQGSFRLTCIGRPVVISQADDGRWEHDQPEDEALFARGEYLATYQRAETLLWCLNTGLAAGEEAVRTANRRMSSFSKPPRYLVVHHGDPTCVPLAMFREGLAHAFRFEGAPPEGDPALAEKLQVALMACRGSKGSLGGHGAVWFYESAIGRADQVLARAEGAQVEMDAPHVLVGMMSVLGDISHMAEARPAPWHLEDSELEAAAEGALQFLAQRNWAWSRACLEAVEQLAPEEQWLYACASAYREAVSTEQHRCPEHLRDTSSTAPATVPDYMAGAIATVLARASGP